MNLYPWLVFIHVTGVLLFFFAHGVSAIIAFRLRSERDPERVRALLDVSRLSVGPTASAALVVGLAAGVAAGFVGGWWGQLWIWLSLVIFVLVGGLMTPLAASKLNAMRIAAGSEVQPPFSRSKAEPPPADPEQLQRLLDDWDPRPLAVLGFGSFVVILGLMMLKPF